MESPSGRECDDDDEPLPRANASTIAVAQDFVIVDVGDDVGASDLVQQLLDAILAGDRLVVRRTSASGTRLSRSLDPICRRRNGAARSSARRAVRAGLVVAKRRVENPRLLKIGRHLHAGDGHEPDPRIVHFARQQQRELAANLVRDAVWTGSLGHELRTTKVTKTRKKYSLRVFVSSWLCRDRDSLHREYLDDVADLEVVELVEADAALEPGLHLARVVLESPQRSDLAFVDDDVVSEEACLGVAGARDAPLGDHAAGDGAELRDLEDVPDLGDARAALP